MQYTQEYLETVLKAAYSYESRDKWDAEGFPTEYIGTLQRSSRFYDIYVDTAQNYWYKVRVMTERGIVSEYEAVFGHLRKKDRL